MDICQATKNYEAWMRDCTKVAESELTWKHARMRTDLFMFFRGTYYRWAQLFASVWKEGKRGHCESYYEKAIALAVRSHDPYQQIFGNWLILRLSPDSNPIEFDDIAKQHDEYALLHAMGKEAANVHLGTRKQIKGVLKHLHGRGKNWLRHAGKVMAKVTEREWKQYKKASR
jgi:hypothetical protein